MLQEMPGWLIAFLDKVVLATLVGLITSCIFLYLLSRFRPTINISPVISKSTDTVEGHPIYCIKVINLTRCPIVDIKAQLHLFKNHQTATGEIWKSQAVTLIRSDPVVIDKFDKADVEVNYAYRFGTYENLETIWNDDKVQFMRFRIYAKHSISGFGLFAHQDFRLKRSSIKLGEFSKGNTFEVV